MDGGKDGTRGDVPGTRKRDPEAVRADIMAVAEAEFAKNGLSGGRIDEIAAKTRTSKRMIYYYFGDKNGLYRAVLEEAYRKVRLEEAELHLDDLEPIEALRQLAAFTFEHHRRSESFIRMVMIENIHSGAFLSQSTSIGDVNRPAIGRVAALLDRGKKAGVFRHEITPLTLHWLISAISYFNVSNRHTFGLIFGDALWTETEQVRLGSECAEIVLRYVLTTDALGDLHPSCADA
ncbi:TetR family transcriptional regulator [Jiella avicenniae]|uniref:TetR family transcriptional regulator n=1 Tax=Jiella avicenniae TaxID=2907202 RepID=A0A9X1P4H0_9HYPH|nr:TetR family transcriptional regulator [Jiella avicenniae]MCE7029599.1 TetR family transcriptional regulator [Jiella avicenniae]